MTCFNNDYNVIMDCKNHSLTSSRILPLKTVTGSLDGPKAKSASDTTSYIPDTPTSAERPSRTALRLRSDLGPAIAGPIGLAGTIASPDGSDFESVPKLRGPCGKRSRSTRFTGRSCTKINVVLKLGSQFILIIIKITNILYTYSERPG